MTAVLAVALLSGCERRNAIPPKTSADARPEDVTFIKLPEDAKAIRFWDDHREQIVVFETTEDQYKAIFSDVALAEIVDKVWYPVRGFGDPDNPPWERQDVGTYATAGLVLELPGDKGGLMYVYDRNSNTGFYIKNGR